MKEKADHRCKSQSHHGSIKMISNVNFEFETKKSQSHYGSIKRKYSEIYQVSMKYCLNPTMVRLKVEQPNATDSGSEGLNPTMVRLKGGYHYGMKGDEYVSIPLWFD